MGSSDWDRFAAFFGGMCLGAGGIALAVALFGCGGLPFTLDTQAAKLETPGFQDAGAVPGEPDPVPPPAPMASSAQAFVPEVADAGQTDVRRSTAAFDVGQPDALPGLAPDAGQPAEAAAEAAAEDGGADARDSGGEADPTQAQCNALKCSSSAECQQSCPAPEQGYTYCCMSQGAYAGSCYSQPGAVCP